MSSVTNTKKTGNEYAKIDNRNPQPQVEILEEEAVNAEKDNDLDFEAANKLEFNQAMEKILKLDPNDPEYAIICKNLTKVYPNGTKALTNFSIAIKKDKIFGLLGPNGAGKSTLLSILTGAFSQTSGEAYL